MSKKNINRVLIVVVSLIWGVLIYKFVNTFFVSSPIEADTIVSQETIDIPLIAKDTFNLKAYERDPFLGTLNKPSKSITNKVYSLTVKKEVPVNQKWPKIQYLGFVKQEKSNDPLLLIKIDNRLYRNKISGEIMESLNIISFYKDSIEVSFNNERRIIKKNL
ncbi:hypothetical protein [Winogradskyella forsetii]|uniref:hypothetical protein n=1 Tax=Winogradskyella forsetii TaxID=2686077 RepID=UPI0015B799FE|nr:hypothetical protein [Winogradskyella forsetii]